MLEIPIQAAPTQIRRVVLAGQNFQIYIYYREQGIFVDVNVDGVDVMLGALARDCVPLISRTYEAVQGNLIFTDTQGAADPIYTEFGTRYFLVYLTADEYAQLQ